MGANTVLGGTGFDTYFWLGTSADVGSYYDTTNGSYGNFAVLAVGAGTPSLGGASSNGLLKGSISNLSVGGVGVDASGFMLAGGGSAAGGNGSPIPSVLPNSGGMQPGSDGLAGIGYAKKPGVAINTNLWVKHVPCGTL